MQKNKKQVEKIEEMLKGKKNEKGGKKKKK